MRPVLLAVSILFASVAVANEIYLPLSGNASGRDSVTELRIVNPSAGSTSVSIELLGSGSDSVAREVTIAARGTLELSDVATLFGTAVDIGALRITSHTALRVTATSRCGACGTSASLPTLTRPLHEGQLASTIRSHPLGWQSSIVLVNPDSADSMVTLTLTRGGAIVDEKRVPVAARGTRVLPMRVLFPNRLLETSPTVEEASELITFSAEQPVVLFGYDVNSRTGARLFTAPRSEAGQRRRRAVRFTSAIVPQTVVLTPSKDNTIYGFLNGERSNGAGPHIFIGTTRFNSLRRALIAFNVASQIPPGSRITRATLTLRVSQTISGPIAASLHAVTADWGEGSSNAGTSSDGAGAPTKPGDATSIHTFFPDRFWSRAGGDFDPAIDAISQGSDDRYTWESSAAMVARVQDWLDRPAANFGWLIMGDETGSSTAKRFDSREEPEAANRPMLTLELER
jgi:hypothetical protein